MHAVMEQGVSAPDREDLLGRVFHGSSQGLLISRAEDGTIIEANDAFLFLIGRDRDDVIGTTTAELGIFEEIGDVRARALIADRGAIDAVNARVRASTGEMRVLRLWAESIGDGGSALVVVRASDADGRAA